jgi:predicted nucleic acid-binding protein
MDTSTYTHLCRAGHASIIERLAPGLLVLIPTDVNDEIERGRTRYPGIPSISSFEWTQLAVLTEEETWTQLQVKAEMAGTTQEHLGECAVIACAYHRNMVAFLDERAAIEQADRLGVPTHDTLWLVIEAYKKLFDRDRDHAAQIVDDLLTTNMYLPIGSGKSLLAWAYEEGLLP